MRRTTDNARARTPRQRFTNGLRRITKGGRKLTAAERAEVVKQMHADGRLGREVR